MYESISDNLSQLGAFVIIGFFMGVSYEPFRIVRLFKKQGVFLVSFQDFLFLTSCGIMTFAYSMELGGGKFRLFFIIAELFGLVIYFLTIGRLVNIFSELIVKIIKAIYRGIRKYVLVPIYSIVHKLFTFIKSKLANIYNFNRKGLNKIHNHLKSSTRIVYNIGSVKIKMKKGDNRNVIKAKIREKT